MLVKNASATTAGTRYNFIFSATLSQYLCSHTVVTTFAISSAPPMIMIGTTAAAKIAIKPNILYQAAIVLNASAVKRVRLEKVNILFGDINIFSKKISKICRYFILLLFRTGVRKYLRIL